MGSPGTVSVYRRPTCVNDGWVRCVYCVAHCTQPPNQEELRRSRSRDGWFTWLAFQWVSSTAPALGRTSPEHLTSQPDKCVRTRAARFGAMRLLTLVALLGVAVAAVRSDDDAHVVKLRHAPGGRLLVPHGAHGVHPDLTQVFRYAGAYTCVSLATCSEERLLGSLTHTTGPVRVEGTCSRLHEQNRRVRAFGDEAVHEPTLFLLADGLRVPRCCKSTSGGG